MNEELRSLAKFIHRNACKNELRLASDNFFQLTDPIESEFLPFESGVMNLAVGQHMSKPIPLPPGQGPWPIKSGRFKNHSRP